MSDHVVLVDGNDNPVGVAEKMDAHRTGRLHRAISVFVFDSRGHLLLQKRASAKYHSGGLWSNTCCSHPRPLEEVLGAGRRRLREEMGFECDLSKAFSFVYRVEFDNELIEHEYDHVLFGRYDGDPIPCADEAEDWKWVELSALAADLKRNPASYTYWFAACFDRAISCFLGADPRSAQAFAQVQAFAHVQA